MKNKIRVLVVDDEPLARRGICHLLKSETDFEVIGEAANGQAAFSQTQKLKPNLVFLDIQMPLLNGFSFVEKICAGNLLESLPEIVFVTAYDEYAIRAFEINALDYVLKPIDAERFQKTLERVRQHVLSGESKILENKFVNLLNNLKSPEENYLRRIAVKETGRIHFLNVEKIDWISSQGNYIEVNSGKEKFLIRETMDGIERKLNPCDFLRIRRSTIVRIEQIEELNLLFNGEFEVVLKMGKKLLSSRYYRHNFDLLLKGSRNKNSMR